MREYSPSNQPAVRGSSHAAFGAWNSARAAAGGRAASCSDRAIAFLETPRARLFAAASKDRQTRRATQTKICPRREIDKGPGKGRPAAGHVRRDSGTNRGERRRLGEVYETTKETWYTTHLTERDGGHRNRNRVIRCLECWGMLGHVGHF